ncbi:MAG: DUF1214 domain-containing protein [Hyphomicrobium sp.]|uniref:DUF1214 domain-containing protein n=1 Tax=Hyphomicrobium sp. TaxID=82 RepID=UPI0039E5AA4C
MATIELEPASIQSKLSVARAIIGIIVRAITVLLTIMLAIAIGLWSSRYMVSRGSPLSVATYGPWQQWPNIGRDDADPYTKAHMVTTGKLRIGSDSAGIFEARTDSDGARLHSSCNYVIDGANMRGLWWSLAVFDARGNLIGNDADRYEFTADTIAPNPNGSFVVTLGRDARPGNWLPTSGAGRLVLVFTVLDPATGLSAEERAERNKHLPIIKREGCS